MTHQGLLTSAFTLLLLSAVVTADSEVEYGVTIDAGSSGSRIYVYQWYQNDRPTLFKFPDLSTSPLNSTQTSLKTKTGTGIGSFGNDTEAIIETLRPLIYNATHAIPADKLSKTLLFLKATAGMRLLSLELQEYILEP